MNNIDSTFARLRAEGRMAFIPFITAGDPDLATMSELIRELARRGASVIEIGIPYSDPIADGPVVQASYTRTLGAGLRVEAIFDAIERLASPPASGTALPPLVTMVSYAIILRYGPERFVTRAKRAGFAGAIVPDLPVEEAEELAAICRSNQFHLILLVTPTTPRERAVAIAKMSSGFIYFVAVVGITGERNELAPAILDELAWLKGQTALPVCVGFGINSPDQVRMMRRVADGVIVGSAIVRRIAEGAGKPTDQIVKSVGDYVGSLVQALD